MHKLILFYFILTSFSLSVSAQSNTDEMLSARRVRDYIQLWPDYERNTFFYTIDSDKNFKRNKSLGQRLVTGVSQKDREVAITMHFFNPIKYSVRTSDTLSEDPSWLSVGKFASALTDLIKMLPNQPDARESVSTVSNAQKIVEKTSDNPIIYNQRSIQTAGIFDTLVALKAADELTRKVFGTNDKRVTTEKNRELINLLKQINSIRSESLAEWKYMSLINNISCLNWPNNLLDQLAEVDKRYYNTRYRSAIRKKLSDLSMCENIQDLSYENDKLIRLIDTLKSQTVENQQLLKSLDNTVSRNIETQFLSPTLLIKDYKQVSLKESVCASYATYSQIVFKRFIRACADNQLLRDHMLDLAEKMSKELTEALHTADETGSDADQLNNSRSRFRNSFIIGRYNVLDDKMRDVTVVLRKRTLNLDVDPPTVGELGDRIIGKIRLRLAQTFIPEFSTGIYYTNLSYPVYGVKVLTQADADVLNKQGVGKNYSTGQTVIDTPDTQKYPVVLAGMLNLTLNALEGLVHPVVQLGVGTGKNRPNLLAGMGLRLTWINPVVISGGAIWAWKRVLNKLAEGSVIDGTTDLEKDLIYQLDTKPKLYLGLQVHF